MHEHETDETFQLFLIDFLPYYTVITESNQFVNLMLYFLCREYLQISQILLPQQ